MGDITRATNLVGREPASAGTGDLLSVVARLFLSGLRALNDDDPLAYIQSHKDRSANQFNLIRTIGTTIRAARGVINLWAALCRRSSVGNRKG